MTLNKPTAIDSIPLNGESGVEFWLTREHSARAVRESIRNRSHLPPVLEDVTFEPVRARFAVKTDSFTAGAIGSVSEFDVYVNQVFNADGRTRILHAVREGVEYEIAVQITSFSRESPGRWGGSMLILDPYWQAAVPETGSSSPLIVSGNVTTSPVIRITGGTACTRRRVTIRSSHPLEAYPIAVNVGGDENNHYVFHHGRRIPYAFEDGVIFFRVDTDWPLNSPTHRAIVDIYSDADLSNDQDAGEFDPAGLTLDKNINDGVISANIEAAPGNPLSPSFAWLLGQSGDHDSSRVYTYGWDDGIKLVDREETGIKVSLKDDVDGYTIVSPLEMSRVSGLNFSVNVGYRRGRNSPGDADKRVMRVIIADIDGAFEDAKPTNPPHQQHPNSRHPDKPYYAQWTFGDITFPNTQSQNIRRTILAKQKDDGGSGGVPVGGGTQYDDFTYEVQEGWQQTSESRFYYRQEWIEDYIPSEFKQVVERFIGCEVTTGAPGVYYLHFPKDAYHGASIPLLSMSIHPKSGEFREAAFFDPYLEVIVPSHDPDIGNAALEKVPLFQAEWVDPDTLEPFESQNTGSSEPEIDLTGVVRVSVVYWTRDSEQPVVAWTRVLRGAPSAARAKPSVGGTVREWKADRRGTGEMERVGVTYEFSNLTVETPGAIQVALRLEPAASNPGEIDWGELKATGNPTITLEKTPTIIVQSTAAQFVDGTLVNQTTGSQITFNECFSDANGLEVDASGQVVNKVVQGVGDVGPVYGLPVPSNGTRWFDLSYGENVITKSGNLGTVSFEWRPRLGVDS